MRGAGGHDDARLAQLDAPDAVVGGGGAEAVTLDRLGDDRVDAPGGHLRIGLVVEVGDLPRHAAEGDDRPGPRVAHARGDRVEGELVGRDRAAADRRDDRELVSGLQDRLRPGVLAVDRQDERQPGGEVLDRGQRVGGAGALRQVELELVAAGPLAQAGEEADGDAHPPEDSGRSNIGRLA